MSQEKHKSEKKRFSRKTLCIVGLATLLAAVIVLVLFLCLGGDSEQKESTASTSGVAKEEQIRIDTAYVPLYFPGAYRDFLLNEQQCEADVIAECFYLVYQGTKTEVFRIYFGNEKLSPEGYLHMEKGVIPVSVVAAKVADVKFVNEEAQELYYRLLEQMNAVVETIRADARFSENSGVAPETQELAVYDWTLALPSGVECEQTQEGEVLRAEFYGTVSGQRVRLYSITLGDIQSESVIGYYSMDGAARPVSVQPDELAYLDGMSEEDQMSVFALMETLNDVVQSIMSSENFTQDSPIGDEIH